MIIRFIVGVVAGMFLGSSLERREINGEENEKDDINGYAIQVHTDGVYGSIYLEYESDYEGAFDMYEKLIQDTVITKGVYKEDKFLKSFIWTPEAEQEIPDQEGIVAIKLYKDGEVINYKSFEQIKS